MQVPICSECIFFREETRYASSCLSSALCLENGMSWIGGVLQPGFWNERVHWSSTTAHNKKCCKPFKLGDVLLLQQSWWTKQEPVCEEAFSVSEARSSQTNCYCTHSFHLPPVPMTALNSWVVSHKYWLSGELHIYLSHPTSGPISRF